MKKLITLALIFVVSPAFSNESLLELQRKAQSQQGQEVPAEPDYVQEINYRVARKIKQLASGGLEFEEATSVVAGFAIDYYSQSKQPPFRQAGVCDSNDDQKDFSKCVEVGLANDDQRRILFAPKGADGYITLHPYKGVGGNMGGLAGLGMSWCDMIGALRIDSYFHRKIDGQWTQAPIEKVSAILTCKEVMDEKSTKIEEVVEMAIRQVLQQ